MLSAIVKGIAKVFGTKNERDLKELIPYVGLINAEFEKLSSITDDELRNKTQGLKDVIHTKLKTIDDEIEILKGKVEDNYDIDILEKEKIFNQIDILEENRNKALEKILWNILPQAFAIVKDTARRFTDNKQLTVQATMLDKQFATSRPHIKINGNTAIWYNKWMAHGTEVIWEMIHYDVQLIGGIVLHQGKVAEMATGEGKTLVATLPAYLNALAGKGIHIVTVNDYLAKRDSEWNAPIFEFHGLTVDCIDKYDSNSLERKKAYQCDIIYGTNNEFGFDYLRDNMAGHTDNLAQGKHHFAMVDEVDSVLIDDARTPLIISGPVPKGDEHEFYDLKPRISKLVEAQKKLASQYLNEAKKILKDGNEQEGGSPLFRVFRGLPKYKPLIKFLSEGGIKQILQKTENYYLQDNQKLMPEADEPLYFTIDEKHNSIELTDKGVDLITREGEDSNFFILPDIGMEIAKLENNTELEEGEMLKQKETLIRDYSTKAQRIHSINQLLKAYTLFEKDVEYIVVDGKVKIVDEQTGRIMEGRRYSDGLHQSIEAKENVKVEDATQTYATITLQNYFRMYHKLSGMTGTAETEAGELLEIYKLDVIVIPTNRNIVRDDREDMVFKTIREKFKAVEDEIIEMTRQGRPVLVGTTSVEISELISRMLNMKKIKHQVLNAKQHAKEADVVMVAGKSGMVTIATNMAGRGTDIKLTPKSRESGGLAIIGTERHESRRVDRQLRGRAGRQGDVGSSQFFVSLEDNLMRLFGSERIAKIMDRLGIDEGEVIQHSMITKSIERAQKKVEENNFAQRKRLLEYDDVMNSQRKVIYTRRRNALFGERLDVDILNMMYDTSEDLVINAKSASDYDSFKINTLSILGMDVNISQEEFDTSVTEILTRKLYQELLKYYQEKNNRIAKDFQPILKNIYKGRDAIVKDIMIPFSDGQNQVGVVVSLERCIETKGKEVSKSMEKIIALSTIDQNWKEHLREMDDLKQSVQNAVYEQKDPLLIYKFESFELFKQFIAKVNEDTVSFMNKAEIPFQTPDQVQEAKSQQVKQNYKESKVESRSTLSGNQENRLPIERAKPVRSKKIYGRNDRINVQYSDGTTKENVKFKNVEEDVKNNNCAIVK